MLAEEQQLQDEAAAAVEVAVPPVTCTTMTQTRHACKRSSSSSVIVKSSSSLSRSNSNSIQQRASSPFTFIETYSVCKQREQQQQQLDEQNRLQLLKNMEKSPLSTSSSSNSNYNSNPIYTSQNLSSKKQFQQTECAVFESELKQISASNELSSQSNEDFRSKLNEVKSKYQNLINLSTLYTKSFSNLDNLSKVIDEFTCDLCKIEITLASQPYLEAVDVAQMSCEIDVIRNLKKMFKQHENDLTTIKSYYQELEASMEKVRSRHFESGAKGSNNTTLVHLNEQRQLDDLKKLDSLIKQLTDRWVNSINLFKNRRSKLKECLHSFEQLNQSLNTEKDKLKTIKNNREVTSTSTDHSIKHLEDSRALIEQCNQKAMQFIQQTKELNEQLNEYKASFKSCSNNNDDDNAELDKSTYDNDNDDDDNADIDTDDVKTANQNLTLNTLNQINELKKNHGDLSQAFGLDLEPDLDDITTSNSQSQIQLIPVSNMQNIKDFCGSQELNLIVKKRNAP
jgi:chromosome segregation ATPase